MSIENMVTIVCVGSRNRPHLKRRAVVARFAPVGAGKWEGQDGFSRAGLREAREDEFGILAASGDYKREPIFDALIDDELLLLGGDISLEEYQGGHKRLGDREAREVHRLRCDFRGCPLNVAIRDDKLFPILNSVSAGELDTLDEGVITLAAVGAILQKQQDLS